ncbi:MAG TPA: hypothetical protein VFW11_19015 [Cyclobacteriaceae bacterium]|nr:hypothetical protein [Cyclobacteriaceae bacterium]
MGHDLLFPMYFDEHGKMLMADDKAIRWLSQPLIKALFQGAKVKVKIKKEILHQKKEAIVLNCLDNCFGHVFFKLWNASVLKKKYTDKSIIVFVPSIMRWLVPDGIDEIWSFEHSFDEIEKHLVGLDDDIKQNLLPRFQKVWMSKAFTHLDLAKVDLKAMLRRDRFDLTKFKAVQPQITFVLREDRFWHRHPFEFFLFKVFVKLGWSKRIFVWRQNHLINRLSALIKSRIDNIRFAATGIGNRSGLLPIIEDKRKVRLTPQDEDDWCKLYARSHIVIGVHGSNMLIPSALSAGFIEILPRHKIRHIAEETLINYNSRYSLFLGRHVDHFASPRLIADHAVSLIRDFPYLFINTEQAI